MNLTIRTVVLCALPLCGCSLLIDDIGFASTDEDAGSGADAGQFDAGPDGAVMDPDGGNDAGSDSGVECSPRAEACDGVDNDCDGAIDEGLMGLLGSPIMIDGDDLGLGSSAFVDVAALDDGFVVAWHIANEDVIRIAVFDGAGSLANEDSITSTTGETLREGRVTVLRTGAIEQIAIAYVQGEQVWVRRYSSAGTRLGPPIELAAFTDYGLGPDNLELTAVDDSTILGVTGDQSSGDLPMTLVRFTPSSGDTQSIQVYPDHIGQLAANAGTLLAATDPQTRGAPVIRRHDPITLELLGVDVWDYSDRCDAAGSTCEAQVTVHAASEATPTRMVIEETVSQVIGGESSSTYCLFVGEIENGLTPLTIIGDCVSRPSAPIGVATRTGVAGVIVGLGTLGTAPYAYLEISTIDSDGAGPVELSDFDPLATPRGHIVAARGTRAYIVGRLAGGGALHAWRLGCE